ncbi:MAG: hypothetical protein IPN34_17390 [Planctomycetes bacterium]|nr:hypothetical protein [Planctomycetota bacterium]
MSSLLPGWVKLLEAVPDRPGRDLPPPLVVGTPDLPRLAERIQLVTDAASAEELLVALRAVDVSAVAVSVACEGRKAFELRSGRAWKDIRSRRPVLATIAVWAQRPDAPSLVLRAALDLRQEAVAEALGAILRMRVVHVFHDAKPALFALWALGLDPDLHQLVDTWVVAACLELGRFHERALPADPLVANSIAAARSLEQQQEEALSLLGQAAKYGIATPSSRAQSDLEAELVRRLRANGLDRHLAELAVADAETILRVYAAQQRNIVAHGLHAHLHTVEFPFAIANARMQWRGVAIDKPAREALRAGAIRAAEHHEAILRRHGLRQTASGSELERVLRELGIADVLRRDGQLCLDDGLLKENEGVHEVIRAFRLQRKHRRLAGEEWMLGLLDGADGRVHPDHRQLAAATGRSSCADPNIAGIGRELRPIAIAPAGQALVELDYEQVEVGVAAAEHDDPDLIAAYNAGDVYSVIAQRLFANQLDAEARAIDGARFKAEHAELRDKAKTMVLATLYGIQAPSLARKLGISERKAEGELQRLLELYPTLRQRFDESVSYGLTKRYASTVTGLRRRLPEGEAPRGWVKNLLRNTPIQGSAAIVFKRAIVELERAFRGSDVWLVLPVHDSILIECPRERVDEVADEAARLMRHALRSIYPRLTPRVSVNASAPHCWNKDSHADSLLNFLEDPDYKIGRTPKRRATTCSIAAPGCRAHRIAYRTGWRGVADRELRLMALA